MTTLREKRNLAGLTALALGQLAGVHECRIYSLERGRMRPRIGEAQRLAAVLSSTPAELFPETFGEKEKRGQHEQV